MAATATIAMLGMVQASFQQQMSGDARSVGRVAAVTSMPWKDMQTTPRTIHLRRQLAQAAEHGAALLASLGLPRLVGPDHIVVDPVAAGDALDLAIATLDALDGDTDVEDGGDD